MATGFKAPLLTPHLTPHRQDCSPASITSPSKAAPSLWLSSLVPSDHRGSASSPPDLGETLLTGQDCGFPRVAWRGYLTTHRRVDRPVIRGGSRLCLFARLHPLLYSTHFYPLTSFLGSLFFSPHSYHPGTTRWADRNTSWRI